MNYQPRHPGEETRKFKPAHIGHRSRSADRRHRPTIKVVKRDERLSFCPTAERAGQVLSREQLMEIAKGSAELAFERSIDVQVSRLRAGGLERRTV